MGKIEGQNLPDWWEIASRSGELGSLARAMAVLSELMPAKTSFQQGVAFICLAAANAKGESAAMTMTEMMAAYEGAFSPAIRAGYNLFVDDLKWIETVADPADKRRKVLKLTEGGMQVVAKMAGELE